MALVIRDLEQMVEETLDRIVDSGIGITNRNASSVIRTIVESIIVENDIQYNQINELYNAYCIDSANEDDLDNLISILGVIRKPATKCTGVATFMRSNPSTSDISIPYAQIISTKQNSDGSIIEFMVVDDNAKIVAGDVSADVNVECMTAGSVYIPSNALNIMNTPIIGIDSVTNNEAITGGSNKEDDKSLRERAKQALLGLGKGTSDALRSVLMGIDGVVDVMVLDMDNGVGTAGIVIVTATIPPSTDLKAVIENTISKTKAAGIKIDVIYPEIVLTNVTVETTDGDADTIGHAILSYFESLKISETFIINQLERTILNACNIPTMDVKTTEPPTNVEIGGTQIIRRGGVITINGVVWNGE